METTTLLKTCHKTSA